MTQVLVLGAGMVGVCTALELQARGHDVALADRRKPGEETSFGNSGVIQAEAAEPYAMPRDMATLLHILTGRTNDVTWSIPGFLSQSAALLSYFRMSAPARHAEISTWYAALTGRSTEDHARWIEAAGAGNLISREGHLEVYRDPARLARSVAGLARIEDRFGLTARVLDGAEVAGEDPAILTPPAGAIHWPQSWTCSDPGGLTSRYADLFAARGGQVLAADAATLRQAGSGWRIGTDQGDHDAGAVVIALGPWAPEVLRPFGYRIRMVLKRGYHRHYDAPAPPRRPFLDVDNGVVVSPMGQGVRVTSGAAIVRQDAPVDARQLDRGAKGLSDLIDLGAPMGTPVWHGTRPCMPDMLPVIGAAPRHPGLWFNFGHGHQGFTLGPTSAILLADAMEGGDTELHRRLAPAHRFAVA